MEPRATRLPSVPCFRGGRTQDDDIAWEPRKHATPPHANLEKKKNSGARRLWFRSWSYMDTRTMDGSDPDFDEQLRQGVTDPQALGQVWDHYRDRLRRLVRLRMDRRLQGRVDPSDVLQEAFVDFQGRVE